MMIDSQAPLGFRGEVINTAVYLHQQSPYEGLTKRDNRNGSQASYPTPHEMLHAFGKTSHDNDSNNISYTAPHNSLQ